MADWTTLKVEHGLREGRFSFEKVILPFILGGILARGSIIGIYPFGIAYGVALILRGGKGLPLGLLGILLGTISLSINEIKPVLGVILVLGALGAVLPLVRKRKWEGIYVAFMTGITVTLVFLLMEFAKPDLYSILSAGLCGILTGGFAVIFRFALLHQDALWRGEFTQEQGIAWLLLLIGFLSGIQGVQLLEMNFPVIVISFFILLISERFGAGTAAGVGALLGFIPQLTFNVQNLMDAGIFGLAGFCTGAFQRFGKLGMGIAFSAVTLILTFFLRENTEFSQLISSAIGLLLFLIWPSSKPGTSFLKHKPLPEVEATVTKVKALAEVIDQIALSYQAAEAEVSEEKPEIPELMNVLVERVCKGCPTIGVCWEREFYKTYHLIFEIFELMEKSGKVESKELSIEWKRHCGRIKEMLLGIQFLMEQERNKEVWRKKLALNNKSLSLQFQNVSQVISHFAKELYGQHNWEGTMPAGLARRRRSFLDVGVAGFTKSENSLSGDNYASLAFNPTQHAFVICDGMGAGESAAKMSSTALTHLEQLLNTGFKAEGAVQALNSILVLRSPEESFVTVDMTIVDLESENVQLIKVGASPSYIKHTEKTEILSSSSLPVGILNQIDIPVIEAEMQAGDYLIMASDGIHDVLKDGTDWLKLFLENVVVKHSQELADKITAEAKRLSNGIMHDDGVVLVICKSNWNS
ncbi:MAG: SpoIIE family protein phosphatase [Desulfitobacteriaceae bacterium]|nr:SpoIIE family protein phosphatase [Desulfitobacteriaceae bacterium]MDD4346072.1 SpoIIE family protein phosphatase [Desulfitobacteriaceae bacterium]MDD4401340.1 SpoIIE family protein phosphatase [Desulfitobacteriaceae bacterium]